MPTRPLARAVLETLERRRLLCTLDHAADVPHFAGGAESAEAEPNDTPATATPWTGTGDTLVGGLASAADADVFGGPLAQGQLLTVDVGTDPGQRHYKPRVEVLNPAGEPVATSGDGHRLRYLAAEAGDHFVRITSASRYGTVTGSYGVTDGGNLVRITIDAPTYLDESEPNDATPDALGTSTRVRGALASAADVDNFTFAANAGQLVLVKLTEAAGRNPAAQLYNPSGALVASSADGTGLAFRATATGTHRVALAAQGAPSVGGYVADVTRYTAGGTPVLEAVGDSFENAPTIALGSAGYGALSAASDVDVFAVDLLAGANYTFSLASGGNAAAHGRAVSLYDEYGRFMETGYTGFVATDAATGFGLRAEKTGRHYLAVEAIDAIGVGPFVLTAQLNWTFPALRDVPLVYHDYVGARQHLGYGPATPLTTPATVPVLTGLYESRYDHYDVDVTTALPTAGTYVTFGAGDFGSIGAYGYGGSFSTNRSQNAVGARRVSGQSLLDDSGSGFTSFGAIRGAASVMNQEIGHASGTYAHARNPLAAMAYDSQSALLSVGTYTPFPWTDSRVPDVELRNEREYYDWLLQSGRFGAEAEPNGTAAQPLTGWLGEMTADALPRNDRVVVAGRVGDAADVDLYSISVAAGARFALDVDAAEFQHPLDARLEVLDSAGVVVASSGDARDRESGFETVDPYLDYTFAAAGTYTLRVTSERATFGNYRLKLTSAAAFDAAGPRVLASLPNGGASFDATRQLTFFFNDQLDPATLTPAHVAVRNAGGAQIAGTLAFDPTDTSLTFWADQPLAAGSYTVTMTGVRDLRGNLLDGESDGTLQFPEVSGDGAAGGAFATSFTVTGADTVPATVSGSSVRRHPYNRVLTTLTFSDELSTLASYAAPWTLRGAGANAALGDADDTFQPLDVLVDKVRHFGNRAVELFTRGAIDFGNYRVEAATRDAAGNVVNVARNVSYTSAVSNGNLLNGPSVSGQSVAANTAAGAPVPSLSVTFSSAVNPATLNATTFKLRRSTDAPFFNGDDAFVAGTVSYDAATFTATFTPAGGPLGAGSYLVELDGVVGADGLALDGEFQSSRMAGNATFSHWQDAPSGDGFAGGAYRAPFVVAPSPDATGPTAAPTFRFEQAPQRVELAFSEPVGGTFDAASFQVTDRATDEPVAGVAFAYDFATDVVTLAMPGGGVLPDGDYRVTVYAGSVTDAAGNPLDGDANGAGGDDLTFDFFVLAGDANRDRAVNFADLSVLAVNYGQSGRTFTQGNFDYSADGAVGFADLSLLAVRYGTTLPALRVAPDPTRSRVFDDVFA